MAKYIVSRGRYRLERKRLGDRAEHPERNQEVNRHDGEQHYRLLLDTHRIPSPGVIELFVLIISFFVSKRKGKIHILATFFCRNVAPDVFGKQNINLILLLQYARRENRMRSGKKKRYLIFGILYIIWSLPFLLLCLSRVGFSTPSDLGEIPFFAIPMSVSILASVLSFRTYAGKDNRRAFRGCTVLLSILGIAVSICVIIYANVMAPTVLVLSSASPLEQALSSGISRFFLYSPISGGCHIGR